MIPMDSRLSLVLLCLLVGLVSLPGSESACSGGRRKSASFSYDDDDDDRAASMGPSPDREDKVEIANMRAYRLVDQISKDYGIDRAKIIDKLGANVVVGQLAEYQPLVAIEHIIREVFQNRTCRTRYICQVGSTMPYYKEHISKDLDDAKSGEKLLTALIYGVRGGNCDRRYKRPCKPTLKGPFKSMQNTRPHCEE